MSCEAKSLLTTYSYLKASEILDTLYSGTSSISGTGPVVRKFVFSFFFFFRLWSKKLLELRSLLRGVVLELLSWALHQWRYLQRDFSRDQERVKTEAVWPIWWGDQLGSPEFNFSVTFINSQLVRLLQVWVLNFASETLEIGPLSVFLTFQTSLSPLYRFAFIQCTMSCEAKSLLTELNAGRRLNPVSFCPTNQLGLVSNFNQSINWHRPSQERSRECSHLTKFDAFRVDNDQVVDIETWITIYTNVSNLRSVPQIHINCYFFYQLCANSVIPSFT